MPYLVIHDADAIQQYVFNTNRLREIRGASSLIDYINRFVTRDLIKQFHGQYIYSGGGGCAAEFSDQEAAQGFCHAVSSLYINQTHTASSTGVVVDYHSDVPPHDPRSFSKALARAHRQLRDEKVRHIRETQVLTSAYFKRCQACGLYPAAEYDQHLPGRGSEGRFICQSCAVKRRQDRFTPIHRYLRRRFYGQYQTDIRFPQDLDDIGDAAHPKGYIGVIFADGNRMGDRLQHILTPSALRNFSHTIDNATRLAISTVLAERQGLLVKDDDQDRPLFPALVPLCGGDDLVVILPGHHALEIAHAFLQTFQDLVRRELSPDVASMLGSREVSACAGVAIAKAHTPLSALFDLAHGLCNLAKERSYDRYVDKEDEESCLDFQVVTTPNWDMPKVTRRALTPRQNTRLTCRPYSIFEVEKLLEAIRTLKREQFPSGKLYDLYRSLWQGRHRATYQYLMLYARAQESQNGVKQQSALLAVEQLLNLGQGRGFPAPWRLWPDSQGQETPYGDLVEIYQFVQT